MNPNLRDRLVDRLPQIRAVVRKASRAQDVDDLSQECCVRIIEKEHLCKDSVRQDHWISKVAKNFSINWRRKKKNEPLYLNGSMEASKALAEEPRYSEEQILWILNQFRNLPDRQRTILQMKYFQDMKNQKIAETLNITPASVSIHLKNALETLRRRSAYHRGLFALVLPWNWFEGKPYALGARIGLSILSGGLIWVSAVAIKSYQSDADLETVTTRTGLKTAPTPKGQRMPPMKESEKRRGAMSDRPGQGVFLDKHRIRWERRVEGDIKKIWTALTTAKEIKKWMSFAKEFELKLGSKIRLATIPGTISALQEHRLIEFTWTDSGGYLRIELESESKTHKVIFTSHNGKDSVWEREPHEGTHQPGGPGTHWPYLAAGWHDMFDRFVSLVEGKPPPSRELFRENLKVYDRRLTEYFSTKPKEDF